MAMPDAVDALIRVSTAPRDSLTRTAYNLAAFSATAEDIRRVTLRAFPEASITWRVDEKRQAIVDSWPADVDDAAARHDWGFDPHYDFARAFDDYLIPTIRERYQADAATREARAPHAQVVRPPSRAMRRGLVVAGLLSVATTMPGFAQRQNMDIIAERYVRLALALGEHDADYVDAYYGPPAWRAQAESEKASLQSIAAQADVLARQLAQTAPSGGLDDLDRLRYQYLNGQLVALRARVAMRTGRKLTFDEESKALYDTVAPKQTEAEFASVLAELGAKVPGSGPLRERLELFRDRFVIPRDRLDATFRAAIDSCRQRTLRHIELPKEERFTLEYVTNQTWSAYNWYQGGYTSVIQVNTGLPVRVDGAVDLACHEGYPGHHVYNVLLEKNLWRGRKWVEFSVYPLFSPQSLIAEGSANYGIDVTFRRPSA
jgi:hypothetical protein